MAWGGPTEGVLALCWLWLPAKDGSLPHRGGLPPLPLTQESAGGNNTLVLFTSDNGAPLGCDDEGNLPLRDGKASTWEGGFREPGIAWWPGHISAGTRSEAIVGTIDIHPTLLSLAGVPLPQDRVMDGMDLSPVLFHNGTG